MKTYIPPSIPVSMILPCHDSAGLLRPQKILAAGKPRGFLLVRPGAVAQPAVSQRFQPANRANALARPVLSTPCRLEIGDTAGWETCATSVAALPLCALRSSRLCGLDPADTLVMAAC